MGSLVFMILVVLCGTSRLLGSNLIGRFVEYAPPSTGGVVSGSISYWSEQGVEYQGKKQVRRSPNRRCSEQAREHEFARKPLALGPSHLTLIPES